MLTECIHYRNSMKFMTWALLYTTKMRSFSNDMEPFANGQTKQTYEQTKKKSGYVIEKKVKFITIYIYTFIWYGMKKMSRGITQLRIKNSIQFRFIYTHSSWIEVKRRRKEIQQNTSHVSFHERMEEKVMV